MTCRNLFKYHIIPHSVKQLKHVTSLRAQTAGRKHATNTQIFRKLQLSCRSYNMIKTIRRDASAHNSKPIPTQYYNRITYRRLSLTSIAQSCNRKTYGDGNELSTNVSHSASLPATHRPLILYRTPPFLIAFFNAETQWRSCAKPNNFHFAPHTLPPT